MRYLTHQFAHLETLQRARRWLVHAGFDPCQIEAVHEGIPRIAVRVRPGEASAVEQIISVAEMTDPEGLPSFWELARQPHIHSRVGFEGAGVEVQPIESRTFLVGYHLSVEQPQMETSNTAALMRETYRERWGI